MIDNSILFTERYRIEKPTCTDGSLFITICIAFNEKVCMKESNPREFSKAGFMFSYCSFVLFFPETEEVWNALGSCTMYITPLNDLSVAKVPEILI